MDQEKSAFLQHFPHSARPGSLLRLLFSSSSSFFSPAHTEIHQAFPIKPLGFRLFSDHHSETNLQIYILRLKSQDCQAFPLGCSAFREANGTPLQYSCLENPMGGGAWWAAVHGVRKSRTRLSDFTFTFHFHTLEKEMATHSSVLAWRIPGMGEAVGFRLWGHTESDTTEVTQQPLQLCIHCQHSIISHSLYNCLIFFPSKNSEKINKEKLMKIDLGPSRGSPHTFTTCHQYRFQQKELYLAPLAGSDTASPPTGGRFSSYLVTAPLRDCHNSANEKLLDFELPVSSKGLLVNNRLSQCPSLLYKSTASSPFLFSNRSACGNK